MTDRPQLPCRLKGGRALAGAEQGIQAAALERGAEPRPVQGQEVGPVFVRRQAGEQGAAQPVGERAVAVAGGEGTKTRHRELAEVALEPGEVEVRRQRVALQACCAILEGGHVAGCQGALGLEKQRALVAGARHGR